MTRILGHVSTALALAALLAGDSALASQGGQGRRGRRRGNRPAQTQPAKPAPEKPKKAKKPPQPIALVGATVHVGDGTVFRRGTVVITGEKITAVGSEVAIPKNAKKFDLTGKHLAPGFVMVELRSMGLPSSPKGKFADSYDPFQPTITRALGAGITSFLHATTKGGSSPSGSSAVVKCLPDSIEGAILKEPAVHSMSVPLGLEGRRKFDEQVEKAKKYLAERRAFEKKKADGDDKAKAPKKDKKLESLLSVLEGKTRLRISAGSSGSVMMRGRRIRFGGGRRGMNARQIREALEISKLLGVGVLLENALEAWILPEEIAATGSACIVHPRTRREPDPTREAEHGTNIAASAILAKAGIPVACMPPTSGYGSGPMLGTGGILGRDLNTPFMDACFAIRGGMDEESALSTITLGPARCLGVDDRIGSLEKGKDADLLVLDGPPLSYKTFVLEAWINGRLRYEKENERVYEHVGTREGGAKRSNRGDW